MITVVTKEFYTGYEDMDSWWWNKVTGVGYRKDGTPHNSNRVRVEHSNRMSHCTDCKGTIKPFENKLKVIAAHGAITRFYCGNCITNGSNHISYSPSTRPSLCRMCGTVIKVDSAPRLQIKLNIKSEKSHDYFLYVCSSCTETIKNLIRR